MIRKSAIVVGVCGALFAVTMPIGASAFEQTTVPAGKLAKASPMAQALPGVELTVPSQAGNNSQTGAAISVPGLGALGALPKLDFGLELLYGSPDAKSPGEASSEIPPDALTVYGSVKKTF